MYSSSKSFSEVNRHQVHVSALKKATFLTPAEEKELNRVVRVMHSGSAEEHEKLKKDLLCNPERIDEVFKYYHRSADFKNYVLTNEFHHLDYWGDVLTKGLKKPKWIQSMNGLDNITVEKLFFAVHLFYKYYDLISKVEGEIDGELRNFYLDYACELGSFEALKQRTDEMAELILKLNPNINKDDKEITDILTLLKSDGKRFGNLYWTAGCVHMACIHLVVGDYLVSNNPVDLRGHNELRLALRSILYARALSSNENLDQEQNKYLLKSTGVMLYWEKNGFKDLESIQNRILQSIDPKKVNLVKEEEDVKLRIQNMLPVSENKQEEGRTW